MAERVEKLPWSMTFYDLLGYIAPGGLLLLCIYVFETWALHLVGPGGALAGRTLHVPIHTLAGMLLSGAANPTWLQSAVTALALGLTVYVAGHVIASMSSTLIERTLVFKGYGYPYETQLGIGAATDAETARWSPVSRAFYTGVFFWFNAYALLRFASLSTPDAWRIPWRQMFLYSARIVGVLLLLQIACKLVLGRVHAAARRRVTEREQERDWRDWGVGRLMEWLLVHAAKPYDGVARLIAGVMGTRRTFDAEFRDLYIRRFRERFDLDPLLAGTNNFWLSYAHVLETSRSTWSRIANWQTLYGFARNLATAFFAAFLYSWFWYRLHRDAFVVPKSFDVRALAALSYGYFLLSLVLLLRYYYLYRGYFTKFVFRAFVYACSGNEPPVREHESRDLGDGVGF